jgi:acetyltransferase-like isoleucine patch superfamily enzyme
MEKRTTENISPNSRKDKDSFLEEMIIIGDEVKISEDVYISPGVKIYGNVKIKSGTYIGDNCIIGHPTSKELEGIIDSKITIKEFKGERILIGKNCKIRANTIIYSDVIMGNNCQTGHNVLIREKTIIGNSTLIGTNCVIDGNTKIGDNVSIQTGVYIPLFSEIGNSVFMGPFSKLTNDKYMKRKKYKLKGPIIEDNVSLGANSIILPGVHIKEGTMIGAGAVVTKDTKENDIIVGNPAHFLKKVPKNWDE